MDMVNSFGLMAENIKEIGNTVNRMVKVYTCNLTAKKRLAYGQMESEFNGFRVKILGNSDFLSINHF
jgi:hypothetical protein